MSKWTKIKKIIAPIEDDLEEVTEKPLYEIQEIPDPKFRLKIVKPLNYFIREIDFQDGETKSCDELLPCPKTRRKYIPAQPFHKTNGNHISMSHSDLNTEAKELSCTSMNHREGGWPEHIKAELSEHTNKFIRQTCKEDMFKWTVSGLIKKTENVLRQNNTMNIEQIYFEDVDDIGNAQTLEVKTLAKFKDHSKHKRPVSSISWQNCENSQFAISYCSSEFLGMYNEQCSDAYIFNMEHTISPLITLASPDHLTMLDFNDKVPHLLAGGCYRGQVCWWDERIGREPTGVSDFETSHTDAVYFVKWIGKVGTEFFTGSSDGLVKWWDIRNFKDPVKQYMLQTSSSAMSEFPPGINCLSFEPTIPSKFMVGTEQGGVVSCRMQAKAGTNDWVLGEFDNCHYGKVMAVDRNPFYPKNFLTIGDTTCKIWCEDLKTSSIMWMKPSAARLTGGAWSPTKISVFFTTRIDGYVEVWDFLHNHKAPILPIKVADAALNCIKVVLYHHHILIIFTRSTTLVGRSVWGEVMEPLP